MANRLPRSDSEGGDLKLHFGKQQIEQSLFSKSSWQWQQL